MFLVGAFGCVLITLLVKIDLIAREKHRPANVVQVDDAQSDHAASALVEPFAVAPVQRSAVLARRPIDHAEPKKQFKTLPVEEIRALNADAPPPVRQNEPETPQEDYTQDPITGAWFTRSNLWQVRDKYQLPIDGDDIRAARMCLRASGVAPDIEMQWWYPRAIAVPERRWKGRVAKLRFLAVLNPAQIHHAEEHLRVVNTRGCTADGQVLVEAEALFYSSHVGVRNLGMAVWDLVSSTVKEKPTWFPDDAVTVKKGETGQLPLNGRDIELVRKAVHEEEGDSPIREVKWWAPRVNRADRHRLSKLRYEVTRSGHARTEEIVFDHNLQRVTYAQLGHDLFPEFDRHASGLEQAHK
jgi:hypothetical protein